MLWSIFFSNRLIIYFIYRTYLKTNAILKISETYKNQLRINRQKNLCQNCVSHQLGSAKTKKKGIGEFFMGKILPGDRKIRSHLQILGINL